MGRFSTRRIARGIYDDVPLRVIAAGEHPHFKTINPSRIDHRDSPAALFEQVYGMCLRVGMFRLGEVSLDGAKINPESRIMVKDGAFIQSYHGQIVVDGVNQIIVAQGVSNQAPDAGGLQEGSRGAAGQHRIPPEKAQRRRRFGRQSAKTASPTPGFL